MTYAQVSRMIVGVAVALGLAAFGFAAFGTRAPAPALGPDHPGAPAASVAPRPEGDGLEAAELYDERCGACHDRGAILDYLRAGPGIDGRQRALEVLLASHGPATGEEIPRIAAYLAGLARR